MNLSNDTTPDDGQLGMTFDEAVLSEKQDRTEKREQLIRKRADQITLALQSGHLTTIEHRVASILSDNIEARNSDAVLVTEYWRRHDSDKLSGNSLHLDSYGQLQQPQSIIRARQFVQNQCRMFVATPEVQHYRGKLSKDAVEQLSSRERALNTYSVFVDETGLTQDFIAVGSIWFLQSRDTSQLWREWEEWRLQTNYKKPLHFVEINKTNLDIYLRAFDRLLTKVPFSSFKAVAMSRKGLRHNDDALRELFVRVLIDGVEHEIKSGRSSLPRILTLTKDESTTGGGKEAVLLSQVRDRVRTVSQAAFGDQLVIGDFRAQNDDGMPAIQMADLFAGSVQRRYQSGAEGTHPKDTFARHVLSRIGFMESTSSQMISDRAVHIWIGNPPVNERADSLENASNDQA